MYVIKVCIVIVIVIKTYREYSNFRNHDMYCYGDDSGYNDYSGSMSTVTVVTAMLLLC